MSACCSTLTDQFDADYVARKLASRREKGPNRTARELVELILREGVRDADMAGASLLDVGAGFGDVGAALFDHGLSTATQVEASAAYSDAARLLAREGGWHDRTRFETGDFIDLADDLPDADIVVLDRVICCYDDMPGLLDLSASRARHLYALSAPRDGWPVRAMIGVENVMRRLKGGAFRTFVHPWGEMDARLRGRGFEPASEARTPAWRIAVYRRRRST